MDIEIIDIPASAKVDLEKWARITVEKWEFNVANLFLISQKHYSSSKEPTARHLINSFVQHVAANAENNTALVNFAFNYYLRMLDSGIGSGVSYGEKGNRKKYPVYSKTFYSEFMKLGELLTRQYAFAGTKLITDSISQK